MYEARGNNDEVLFQITFLPALCRVFWPGSSRSVYLFDVRGVIQLVLNPQSLCVKPV